MSQETQEGEYSRISIFNAKRGAILGGVMGLVGGIILSFKPEVKDVPLEARVAAVGVLVPLTSLIFAGLGYIGQYLEKYLDKL